MDSLTREAGMEYLERDGNLRVPCSRYGSWTDECAPVAWRVAEIVSDATGEPITEDALDFTMGLVVNDSDDPESLIREHGTREDLELLDR